MGNTDLEDQVAQLQKLLKQMEGVEHNACTMRTLADIYKEAVTELPSVTEAIIAVLRLLETLHERAVSNIHNVQKLPAHEQHFLYHGEVSAQESFVDILLEAFASKEMTDDERTSFIVQKAENHALEALDSVEKPLREARFLMDIVMPFLEE